MKRFTVCVLSVLLLAIPLSSSAIFGKKDPDKLRAGLQEQRSAALEKLYAGRPSAREELASAKGYAVFSNIGINLFLVSTERGGGILHDNRNGSETYMKMFSAGGGFGMGVKDFALVFVFHTVDAMNDFQSEGWDFSGQADAGAKSGDKGVGAEAAMTVIPGTSIYQLTDAGIALQATLKGTKFWADEDLN